MRKQQEYKDRKKGGMEQWKKIYFESCKGFKDCFVRLRLPRKDGHVSWLCEGCLNET